MKTLAQPDVAMVISSGERELCSQAAIWRVLTDL